MPTKGSHCPPYTAAETAFILDALKRMPGTEVAKQLGRSYRGLCNFLHQRGIKMRRVNDSYPVNPDQFYDITTPEVAYLLGYIWADGYIGDRHVQLGPCMVTDMANIERTVNATGQWRKRARHPRQATHQEQLGYFCHHAPLARYLGDKLGYYDKSLENPSKVLAKTPPHLRHYWWRGYFDGDGCISAGVSKEGGVNYVNVTITGDHDQKWDEALTLADDLFIRAEVYQRVMEGGRASHIRIQDTAGILRFLAYLYQGRETDGIGLDRKYQRYLAFKATIAQRRSGGFIGVQPVAGRAVYVAKMKHDYEGKYLGFFKTEKEAARAYDLAAIRRYGCYADTNFPIESYMPFMKIDTATVTEKDG